MFPTMLSLSLTGLGSCKPQASGVLCTAIVGGAIIPPLYGFFTDSLDFKPALILVVLSYFYTFFFARKSHSYIRSYVDN